MIPECSSSHVENKYNVLKKPKIDRNSRQIEQNNLLSDKHNKTRIVKQTTFKYN